MKSSITYIKILIKLYLIILIYSFALNCSTKESPLVPVTNDCLNGEIKNAQGLCVPNPNQNQVSESNTCSNNCNITFNLAYPEAEAIQSITNQKAGDYPFYSNPNKSRLCFQRLVI